MPSTPLVQNGAVTDQANAALLVTAQAAGTHVGQSTVSFPFSHNGQIIEIRANNPFIAGPALYAALQASAQASANITWTN